MHDIFISYANADKERISPIVRQLLDQGWTVWWDQLIPIGKVFDDVIENAVSNSTCVIVIWSKASVNSQWVRTEAAESAQRGVLVPILIDDVKIPFEFRRIQAARLIDWTGDATAPAFVELKNAIAALIKKQVGREPTNPASEVDQHEVEAVPTDIVLEAVDEKGPGSLDRWLNTRTLRAVGIASIVVAGLLGLGFIVNRMSRGSATLNNNGTLATVSPPIETPGETHPPESPTPNTKATPQSRPTALQKDKVPVLISRGKTFCLRDHLYVYLSLTNSNLVHSTRYSSNTGTFSKSLDPNLSQTWDLTGFRPGRYTATAEVQYGDNQTHTSSVQVTVAPCN